ncbi:MAG: D-alanine--D-alanine ligase, partial [Candidatus Omnitrophota bacterium]
MAQLKIKQGSPASGHGEKFGRVGVLMGGPSTEREISLKSGSAVYDALKALGLDVTAIEIKSDKIEENLRFLESQQLDCVFIALHGRFGEDGQIQDILERLHIPYSGSGVSASRLAMDKISSRRIFEDGGLAVPPYEVVEKSYYVDGWSFDGSFQPPLVVKPSSHGSSIGLS